MKFEVEPAIPWDLSYEFRSDIFDINMTHEDINTTHEALGICASDLCVYIREINAYDISKIYRNLDKRTVVVVWATGHKTKVKCADDDSDNIFFAVAAAVMKRKYGSNSAFKTRIERNLGLYSDRAYKNISMWETCEIYGGHEKFIDVVNSKVVRSPFVRDNSKERKHGKD